MAELDTVDNFMIDFRHYRRKQPPPSLSDVLDFENLDANNRKLVEIINLQEPNHPAIHGLKPVKEWSAYRLTQCPGFIFIVNPFEDGWHTYWTKRCIYDYPDKPNITNMDAHIDTEEIGNIWKASQDSQKCDITSKESLIMKLRWVTLGYHYHWANKKYYKDRHTAFPDDLSQLCRYIGVALGFQDFTAEAAIVNYYHLDSTLSGHTDHSEFDHTAPLISISLGQDGIFLLGGKSKSEKPVAMFLRSGDICIMSGESRLCYHGIPKIMFADKTRIAKNFSENINDCISVLGDNDGQKQVLSEDDEQKNICDIDKSLFFKYLNRTRVNISVRQVLLPGTDFPADVSVT